MAFFGFKTHSKIFSWVISTPPYRCPFQRPLIGGQVKMIFVNCIIESIICIDLYEKKQASYTIIDCKLNTLTSQPLLSSSVQIILPLRDLWFGLILSCLTKSIAWRFCPIVRDIMKSQDIFRPPPNWNKSSSAKLKAD